MIRLRMEADDEVSDDDLPSVVKGLADGVSAMLALLPRIRSLEIAGRVERTTERAPGSGPGDDQDGGAPPSLTGWDARKLRQLCDDLPEELSWDSEKHDRGEQAREGESADYVDGFNDGLAHAREIADAARGALAELEAIARASEEYGVEHLELWRALASFGGLRRRAYNALVASGLTAPAALRALDARALRGLPQIGTSMIHRFAKAGLVDESVARSAVDRKYEP